MGDCNTLKNFPNPRDCDPNLDQTKLNDLLPLTIDGDLVEISFYEYNTELGMFKYNVTPILDKCVHVYKPFEDFFSCSGLMWSVHRIVDC